MLDSHYGIHKLAEGAVELILDVGKTSFNDAYAKYLHDYANVTAYMIVAFRPGAYSEPQLLMSSSSDLSILYRAVFYRQDPNRKVILDQPRDGMVFYFPGLADPHYSDTYRQLIFQSSGIIDKFSTACWNDGICYYANCYRVHGETPFSGRERKQLLEVSDLISHLIVRHFEAEDQLGETTAALAELNLEQVVRDLSPSSPLSEREAQVCTLILTGCSSEAIALRLGIAVSSVLTYRRRAYERLGIVSQNELFAKVLAKLGQSQLR